MQPSGAGTVAAAGACRLSDVATPFALIDGRRLRRNIAEMASAIDALGATLRPHFKTHRTTRIAQLQREAGATGVLATMAFLVVFRVLISDFF